MHSLATNVSIIVPEIEIVDRSLNSIRYLEHGWPTVLCRWHAHDEYELHLIVETMGRAFVGDYIGVFEPGSLYLTGPLVPHNWITDKESSGSVPVRDMLVQFDDAGLKIGLSAYPEFRELANLLQMSASGIEFIGFDQNEAKQRFEEIRSCEGLKRVLLCLDFLLRLSQWKEIKTLSTARVTNINMVESHSRIVSIIDHIVANYQEKLSLEESSSMACMSTSAFSRHFRATTGNRYIDFVNRVRIGKACVRLYETDDLISTISFDVGYRNLANFNRQFVRIKGTTPRAYRNEARRRLVS